MIALNPPNFGLATLSRDFTWTKCQSTPASLKKERRVVIFKTFKMKGVRYLTFLQYGQWVLIDENGENFGSFISAERAKKWLEKSNNGSLGKAELRIKPL